MFNDVYKLSYQKQVSCLYYSTDHQTSNKDTA